MDEFEEQKSLLLYRQNLTVGDVVVACASGPSFAERTFKQQHNSKLSGKFEEACHEMGVEFRPAPLEPHVEIELRRGRAPPTLLDETECRRFDADVCFGCHNVYVAGVNMRVRVDYGRRKPKKAFGGEVSGRSRRRDRRQQRAVVFECLLCGVCTVFRNTLSAAGTTPAAETAPAEHPPLNTLGVGVGVGAGSTNPPAAKKSRRARKKKGGLSELLQRKQEERRREQDGDGSGGTSSFFPSLLT